MADPKKKKTKSKKAARSRTPGGKNVEPRTEAGVPRRIRIGWDQAAFVFLLVIMSAQMVWMADVKSATMDEPNHIARGTVYLRTGDLRLGRVHPPLIDCICALPLALDRNVVLPLDHPSWEERNLDTFSSEFVWKANQNGHSIVFRARLPIVALTLLLAGIVYCWARELFGRNAGLLALTLFALDPNVLAHGSLATNDLGFACFATLSLYTFWRWLRQPAWPRAVLAGIAFGLAQASKFSAVLLIPGLALVALAYWLFSPAEQRPRVKATQLLAWLSLIGVAGVIVVWLIYGFKVGLSGQETTIPAPAYFDELKGIIERVGKGNPTFLLGSYSNTGWWYYFPVAFVVKTPLPTLLLVGASFAYAWRHRTWRQGLLLLIPVVVHFAFSMFSGFNIGYRHLLPALVLLVIFASQLAQGRFHIRSKAVWVGAILLVWLAVGTLSRLPDHLAYFNEIAGGPSHGYEVLVDSNLDWGQDLIGLRNYMEREGIKSVNLSYFGIVDPGAYGINYQPLPGYPRYIWRHNSFPPFLLRPAPGVYAISATNLQGALFEIHNMYAWFRNRTPDAVIGHSIFIYRVNG